MPDIHSSLKLACHARACIPVVREPGVPVPTLRMDIEKEPLPDPANIQGDVYLLFPKVTA